MMPRTRGMRNNRLVFLLFLIGIGLVLRYCNKPHPLEMIKADLYELVGIKKPRRSSTADSNEERTDRRKRSSDESYDSEASDSQENTGSASTSLGSLEDYLPAYDKNAQIIRRRGYILDYEEPYEQAAWVVHFLLNKKGNARRADSFQPDPLVETKTALPNDYTNTGYDRGHLAPAGDFNYDQKLKNESFYMSNMSPQAHDFNTGIWSHIEQRVRSWTKKRGDLVIVTGPVLRKGLPTIGKSTDIAVPEYYYKLIYDPKRQEAIAFLIGNKGWVNVNMQDFTTSIDEVEKKTGIDFFAKLPKAQQAKFEAQHDVKAWFGREK